MAWQETTTTPNLRRVNALVSGKPYAPFSTPPSYLAYHIPTQPSPHTPCPALSPARPAVTRTCVATTHTVAAHNARSAERCNGQHFCKSPFPSQTIVPASTRLFPSPMCMCRGVQERARLISTVQQHHNTLIDTGALGTATDRPRNPSLSPPPLVVVANLPSYRTAHLHFNNLAFLDHAQVLHLPIILHWCTFPCPPNPSTHWPSCCTLVRHMSPASSHVILRAHRIYSAAFTANLCASYPNYICVAPISMPPPNPSTFP